MKVIELDLDKYLSSSEYNPSPHRFDPTEKPVQERMILPIVYTCENCDYQISLSLEKFKKYTNSEFTNLDPADRKFIVDYIQKIDLKSTIDFNCPKCKQPTTLLFNGGHSGYWGEYFFKIIKLLVIKK
jgi:DNA-directed RNA polymerase subunit M/transcription elongation factor TFIIS